MFSWFSLMTLEVILSTSFGVESPVQTESINNMFLVKSREFFKTPLTIRFMLMLPFSDQMIGMLQKLSGRQNFFQEVAADILKTRKNQGIQRGLWYRSA